MTLKQVDELSHLDELSVDAFSLPGKYVSSLLSNERSFFNLHNSVGHFEHVILEVLASKLDLK